MTGATVPLTPREVAAALGATLTGLRAECAAFPPAALTWHPAPESWCVLEVIGHLIEAEARGFAGRVRALLAETDPEFRTWDQAVAAAARRDCERPPASVLEEFGRAREASIALVEGLRPADLGRTGRHPTVGPLSIGNLLAEWLHHDRNHVQQILANVQAYVWPHMGNARRFSRPEA
jgi:hypothetical protein